MSTQTRERNYKRNPHTARFLMAFHAGSAGLPADVAPDADIQHEVPVQAPAYQPSAAQVALISKLILEVHALDAELGSQAGTYTAAMDREGAWTRENTSRWIGNLIKKSRELRASAPAPTTVVQVADGRYAVEEDGVLKFFKVKNGRKAGMVFLDIQASDEWHGVRNMGRLLAVLALIAADPKGAMVRYGRELGECGRCGRVLTSEYRKAGIGPVCIDK